MHADRTSCAFFFVTATVDSRSISQPTNSDCVSARCLLVLDMHITITQLENYIYSRRKLDTHFSSYRRYISGGWRDWRHGNTLLPSQDDTDRAFCTSSIFGFTHLAIGSRNYQRFPYLKNHDPACFCRSVCIVHLCVTSSEGKKHLGAFRLRLLHASLGTQYT